MYYKNWYLHSIFKASRPMKPARPLGGHQVKEVWNPSQESFTDLLDTLFYRNTSGCNWIQFKKQMATVARRVTSQKQLVSCNTSNPKVQKLRLTPEISYTALIFFVMDLNGPLWRLIGNLEEDAEICAHDNFCGWDFKHFLVLGRNHPKRWMKPTWFD